MLREFISLIYKNVKRLKRYRQVTYNQSLRALQANPTTTPPLHCKLQAVILDNFYFDHQLYYHLVPKTDHQIELAQNEDGIVLDRNQTASFDTMVNAFFELRYVEYINLDFVILKVRTSGKGRITIYRATDGGVLPIDVKNVESAGEVTFSISLDQPSRSQLGRLFFVAAATSQRFAIHEAAWMAPLHLVRRAQPSIDVAICTYNNPTQTISNAINILHESDLTNCIRKIYIVDQGEDRIQSHGTFQMLARNPMFQEKVQIIVQNNLGGSGGFTRAIMESLSHREPTHVLLLDDDIVIDPRIIERVANIYRMTEKQYVFGGLMMDLFRPHYLAAHAEVFDYEIGGCRSIQPTDLDCAAQGSLNVFLEPEAPTYNAWWFCCIPLELVRAHGLPLPFFIRADDAEYGTRLTNNGAEILQLPGVFVWHQPFTSKAAAWMAYYSLRNDLILCNLRTPYHSKLRMRYWRLFWFMLTTYRYDHVLAAILALEDYLEGPDVIFRNISSRHKRVKQQLAEVSPRTLDRNAYSSITGNPSERFAPFIPHLLRQAACAWWSYIMPDRQMNRLEMESLPPIFTDRHHWLYVYGQHAVKVLSRHSKEVHLYQKRRNLAWKLTIRFLRVMRKWKLSAEEISDIYAERSKNYSTFEEWKRLISDEG